MKLHPQTSDHDNKPTAAASSPVRNWLDASSAPPPHRLPPSATELIGRENDLRAIGELLRQRRLVTLNGPGGVGKSRLAQQLAWNSLPYYHDGVFWISLVGLSEPEYLLATLIEKLGLTSHTEIDPQTQLVNYLSSRQALLVIDNFEPMLTAAPFLAEIVNQTGAVTILVTSRERLSLYEEWVYEVRGL